MREELVDIDSSGITHLKNERKDSQISDWNEEQKRNNNFDDISSDDTQLE